MTNPNPKTFFIGIAILIIAIALIFKAKPELLDFMSSPSTMQFEPTNIETKKVVAPTKKPTVITLPAWGTIQPGTQFSDYAPGEIRGGIRLAGKQNETVDFDGIIEIETRARVLQRVANQYQVSYNGATVWVPLAAVKLTGK